MQLRTSTLIQAGFLDPAAASTYLAQLPEPGPLVELLARVGDPDLALRQLVRIGEVDPGISRLDRPELWPRLAALLGGSHALGDYLVSHWLTLPPAELLSPDTPAAPRELLLEAVGADPEAAVPVATHPDAVSRLRDRYRQLLLGVATADLASPEPVADVTQVARQLTNLADSALEAALASARAELDPTGELPLAVLALGKAGGQELNYVSDVDLLCLTGDELDAAGLARAADLVRLMSSALMAPGARPPLWAVDFGLRPEGGDGALVRTLASTVEYYQRWAEPWEFQALMKARGAAGDLELADRFKAAVDPMVWSVASRPDFVEATRELRQQAEETVGAGTRSRELKLSAGGLRDIEFTVQLLQLTHGQADPLIRSANTVEAIDQLGKGGYLSRAQVGPLTDSYRFLRLLEHRVQLQQLRRTHTLPTAESAQRALGRTIDPERFRSPAQLERELAALRHRVRGFQQDVYYRPIVEATAQLGAGRALLVPGQAADRLRAIGYRDPQGALAALQALTTGLSRRARIQQNLSPVIVEWLSQGADPDMGLLSFRTLSEQIGSSHWYLSLLRDSRHASHRLCRVLSTSRWAEGALAAHPLAISWLDSSRELQPSPPDQLREQAQAILSRHDDSERALGRVASYLSEEVTRAGLADLTGGFAPVRPALTSVGEIGVECALTLALRERVAQQGRVEVNLVAIAMGHLGGGENSYASDLDLVVVHEPVEANPAEAAQAAGAIVARMRELLAGVRQEAMMGTDFDLRPEGKNGALSPSLAYLTEYYDRWASAWERQALLRARPIGPETELSRAYLAVVDRHRWDLPLDPGAAKEIRLLKARMEKERLPRAVAPAKHVKLGPGGMADVEWTVQLLQLRSVAKHPELRVQSTEAALSALTELGVLPESDAAQLRASWELAARIRAANALCGPVGQPGRADQLPRAGLEARRVAVGLGYAPGEEEQLVQDWLTTSRHARKVMEAHFWA